MSAMFLCVTESLLNGMKTLTAFTENVAPMFIYFIQLLNTVRLECFKFSLDFFNHLAVCLCTVR